MIPSSAQVAENIRKHAEGMAREIASRAVADGAFGGRAQDIVIIERAALAVMLDWYLGDFIPGGKQ